MNNYKIEGTLGEGAYGVVLRCRRRNDNTLVAIKRFVPLAPPQSAVWMR